jgi:hypothetical protein
MAVIMVEERFDPALDLSQGSPVADKISPCLPVYDMAWLSSYIAADGTDAETVRRAYRTAGLDFVSVWTAHPLHRSAD